MCPQCPHRETIYEAGLALRQGAALGLIRFGTRWSWRARAWFWRWDIWRRRRF